MSQSRTAVGEAAGGEFAMPSWALITAGSTSVIAAALPVATDVLDAEVPGVFFFGFLCPMPLVVLLVFETGIGKAARALFTTASLALLATPILWKLSDSAAYAEWALLHDSVSLSRAIAWIAIIAGLIIAPRISRSFTAPLLIFGCLLIGTILSPALFLPIAFRSEPGGDWEARFLDLAITLVLVSKLSRLAVVAVFFASVIHGLRPQRSHWRATTSLYVTLLALFMVQHVSTWRAVGSLQEAIANLAFALTLSILSAVLFLQLLYRAWSLIQDGHARVTPGKAVGLLLLPVFNLYWIYVAWVGLVQDMNAYQQRQGIDGRRPSAGLLAFVLYGGILSGVADRIIHPVEGAAMWLLAAPLVIVNVCAFKAVIDLCSAINDIADADPSIADAGQPR